MFLEVGWWLKNGVKNLGSLLEEYYVCLMIGDGEEIIIFVILICVNIDVVV